MTNKALEKIFMDNYEMHSESIFRFILFKIDNRDKALDLMQETFMKTWLHITKKGEPQNTRAFLYKVASNLVIDEYRKRGRKDYGTESLDNLSEDGFEPANDINEIEAMTNRLDGEKVMDLVNGLPDIYSSILFMKYNEDLTINEISESLNVSQNVVSVRINRALKKLKDMVEKEIQKHSKENE